MVDLCDKGSESEELSSQTPTPDRLTSGSSNVKTCLNCGTSKTPLWRGGPAGPKSLCNACGIRSRKKMRALMCVTKEEKKAKKPANARSLNHQSSSNYSCTSSSGDSTGKFGKKLCAFELDVAWQRPRSNMYQRRKLGEEEQAAILLMALSCSSVYA